MKLKAFLVTFLGVIVLSFFLPHALQANVFTVDMVDPTKKPKIKVSTKDKDGKVVELDAIVDTGNSDGLYVNQNTATALGLTVGGDQKVRGAGGITTLKKTNFTGDKALAVQKVDVPMGQATKTLTISGEGIIGASLPDNTILLGQTFLSQFVQTFNPKTSKLILTALDQLDKKPEVQPKEKPAANKADGKSALNLFEDATGPNWVVNMDIASQTSEFVIGPAYEMSLISEELALDLGLDLSSLPLVSFPTYLGDVNVWKIDLPYILFPGDPTAFNGFGVLPNSFNPDFINILGSDILGTVGTYQIDTSENRLRAGEIVPEPSTIVLSLIGLLGVAFFPLFFNQKSESV